MGDIEVVRGDDLAEGARTVGVRRGRAFDTGFALFSRTVIPPGAVSQWHHHAKRDLLGYVVMGRLRLEYGIGGRDSVEVGVGDFFRIPPGLVHKDVNPDSSSETQIVNVLVGEGDLVVNVDGPIEPE